MGGGIVPALRLDRPPSSNHPPPPPALPHTPADDVQKLADLLDGEGRTATPEFFPTPSCPFYVYKLGALSPYGDEALAALQYGAEHAAGLDGPGLTQHLVTYFKVSVRVLTHTFSTGERPQVPSRPPLLLPAWSEKLPDSWRWSQ